MKLQIHESWLRRGSEGARRRPQRGVWRGGVQGLGAGIDCPCGQPTAMNALVRGRPSGGGPLIETLPLGAATRRWFGSTFEGPTAVQAAGWRLLQARRHALLLAPTGSGKTLAAFLVGLDRLLHRGGTGERGEDAGFRLLYISPLKALAHDVERNLQRPLRGIQAAAAELGIALAPVEVAIRTGDTKASARAKMARRPGHVLVTTPESLYLMLGSGVAQALRTVETVIVDEVHALCGSKRGAHLLLSLERLDALCGRDCQRVGLSATARPVERVAAWLGGDREVAIGDAREAPRLRLQVADALELPMAPPALAAGAAGAESAMASSALTAETTMARRALHATVPALTMPGETPLCARLLPAILARRTTILFVGARGTAERLANELDALYGGPLTLAHHGSLSHSRRAEVEAALAAGEVRAIVATSSLELGIDMAAVDQVICIGSPGRVSSGLQRIGRAGHGVGQTSEGWILPRPGLDLLEAAVVGAEMLAGHLEPLPPPRPMLDVLAQQLVAMAATSPTPRLQLLRTVRRAAGYEALSEAVLDGVLAMLAGRLPATELAEVRPLLQWDRDSDVISGRRGAGIVAASHAGTIPDRGLFAVHIGQGGPKVGELDEEMVFEARVGQVIVLGASAWRIEEISRDRVLVSPAPGQTGTLPYWRGDGPGRPLALGLAIGALLRAAQPIPVAELPAFLQAQTPLSAGLATKLAAILDEQRQATAVLPSDRTVVVERFCDDLGDLRVCILGPLGARVFAPWALALEELLGEVTGVTVRSVWTDDGIVLTLAALDEDPFAQTPERWLPDPDRLDDLLTERLASSALFSGLFRENAARALLVRKHHPTARQPLWAQRLRAQRLLSVTSQQPDFPIVIETYRQAIQDVFDLEALRTLLQQARDGAILLRVVDSVRPSPMARNLAYRMVSTFMYEADAPVAERRAAALTLDRTMLAELLGNVDLRALLDPVAIAEVEAALASRPLPDVDDGWTLGDRLRLFASRRGPFTLAEALAALAVDIEALRPTATTLVRVGALVEGALRGDLPTPQLCDSAVLRRIQRLSLQRARAAVAAVDGGAFCRLLQRWQGAGGHEAPANRDLWAVLSQLEGVALPVSEWERRVLPSRLPDYQPSALDALLAGGSLVFCGRRALGTGDGKLALLRRDRLHLHWEQPPSPDPDSLDAAVLRCLQERGALFVFDLRLALPHCAPAHAGADAQELGEALFRLCFAGHITNDSLQPLRARNAGVTGQPPTQLGLRRQGRLGREGAATALAASGGRWSLLRALPGLDPTADAVHRATTLLSRYGVLGRDCLALEDGTGGFASLRPALRALEERGRALQGHFVADLEGQQFALGSAVELLRASAGPPRITALPALDPAQPWGRALAWPLRTAPEALLRLQAGATLLLRDGEPLAFLSNNGTTLYTFSSVVSLSETDLRAGLTRLMEVHGQRRFRLQQVDGVPAEATALRPHLLAIGFVADGAGLRWARL